MSKKEIKKLKISEQTKEILAKVGLDYPIHKINVPVSLGGVDYENPYHFLLNPKTKEVINTCMKGYYVTQNDAIVELVRRGVQNFKDVSFRGVMGGEIHGGRRIFLQLAVTGVSHVGQDEVKQYITILDSNDGSSQLCVGIGDIVASCKNQYYQFYRRGQSKFKHTSSLEQRIQEIPQLIEVALSRSMKMVELYTEMANTTIDASVIDELVFNLLGYNIDDEKTGRAESNLQNLLTALDIELADGMNVWNLHNGVTRWTTHTKQAPKRANGRLESLMVGTNYKTNQKSFEFALGLIGKDISVLENDLVVSK